MHQEYPFIYRCGNGQEIEVKEGSIGNNSNNITKRPRTKAISRSTSKARGLIEEEIMHIMHLAIVIPLTLWKIS